MAATRFDTLGHITLNNGHRRDSPRSEVDSSILPRLLHEARTGAIPFEGQSCRCLWVRGGRQRFLAVTLLGTPDDRPHLTMWVCWDAEHSAAHWEAVKLSCDASQASFGGKLLQPGTFPAAPAAVPWLAVLLWPSVDPAIAGMLGDFERCLAWALIEEEA